MSSPAYAECPGRTLEAPTDQRARTARSRPWLLPDSTAFAVECGVLNGGGATDGPRGSRRLWRLRGACARPPDETPPAFFFQAEAGIRDVAVTGVQTCALPISGLFMIPVFLSRLPRVALPCDKYTGIMNRPATATRKPHSSRGGNSRKAIFPMM